MLKFDISQLTVVFKPQISSSFLNLVRRNMRYNRLMSSHCMGLYSILDTKCSISVIFLIADTPV